MPVGCQLTPGALTLPSGATVEFDSVEDLRPVCPNCHAVLHLGARGRNIEEVRQLVARSPA